MSRRRQDVRRRRMDLPDAASIRRRIQNVSLRPERPVRQMHRTLRTQVIIFADVDDATEGEWLLMGMSPTLQNAWGGESDPYESVDTLASWAIQKETKLTMIRNLQKGRETDHKATTTPRNPNGTYRPALTTQQGGDAMEPDAIRRKPNLNLSAEEV